MNGKVERGYFGVVPVQLTPEFARDLGLEVVSGVMVNSVVQGSPAARAGIRAFDVIVRIGDENIYQVTRLLDVIAQLTPNVDVPVKILRGSKVIDFVIKVGPRPENPLKQDEFEMVRNVG